MRGDAAEYGSTEEARDDCRPGLLGRGRGYALGLQGPLSVVGDVEALVEVVGEEEGVGPQVVECLPDRQTCGRRRGGDDHRTPNYGATV